MGQSSDRLKKQNAQQGRRYQWGETAMIAQWLKDALALRGMSQAELARRLNVDRVVVNRVLKGTRRLSGDELLRICQILDVSAPNTGQDVNDGLSASLPDRTSLRQLSYISVVGEVAAGVWNDMNYVDFDEFDIPYVADPKWPKEAVKALRIRGESINRQAKEGDFAAILDVYAAPREPRDGDWVIVHRLRGDLIESTVKQVREVDGKMLLMPDSTHPSFQEAIPLTDGSPTDEVRIVAFVLDFIRPATKF